MPNARRKNEDPPAIPPDEPPPMPQPSDEMDDLERDMEYFVEPEEALGTRGDSLE